MQISSFFNSPQSMQCTYMLHSQIPDEWASDELIINDDEIEWIWNCTAQLCIWGYG